MAAMQMAMSHQRRSHIRRKPESKTIAQPTSHVSFLRIDEINARQKITELRLAYGNTNSAQTDMYESLQYNRPTLRAHASTEPNAAIPGGTRSADNGGPLRVNSALSAMRNIKFEDGAVTQLAAILHNMPLTQRESQVLEQIVGAASNKETAQNLGISERTVEAHRAHIMAKLNAKNTADLVRIVLAGARN